MKNWVNKILAFFSIKKLNSPKTAQKVLRIVENTPDTKWTTGKVKEKLTGNCCVLGHIAEAEGIIPRDTTQVIAVCKLAAEINKSTTKFMKEKHSIYIEIYYINDRDGYNGYNEKHPKERITHLLKDMIKAGY